MRDLLHLLRTDLRRLRKTPSVMLLWLAFPLAISVIEYFAFGQIGQSSSGLPKGTLLLVDRDQSMLSGFFVSALQRQPLADFFDTVKLDSVELISKRLEDNEGSAALVLPAGFQDSVVAGKPVDLVYTPNPREVIRPQMVDAALRTFLEVGNRFLHESDAALAQVRAMQVAGGTPSRATVLSVTAAFYDVGQGFQKLGALADLEVKMQRPPPKPGHVARTGGATNFFAYFLPGLLLFSLLMTGQGFERRYFTARQTGIVRRIASAPLRHGTVLVAECAGIMIGVLILGSIMLVLGTLLFKIQLRQPAVLVATLLGFSLFVVGLMKALYGRARSKRAGETVGSVVVLLTTLVGGGFAPVEIYAASVRPFAAASPVGCASQSLVGALVHDQGLAEVAPTLLGIWAWGIALCILGIALSWRSHART